MQCAVAVSDAGAELERSERQKNSTRDDVAEGEDGMRREAAVVSAQLRRAFCHEGIGYSKPAQDALPQRLGMRGRVGQVRNPVSGRNHADKDKRQHGNPQGPRESSNLTHSPP